MTLGKREHPDARSELREAALYYEGKRDGWGDVFLNAVDAAIESIRDPSITWGFYRDRKRTPQIYSRSVAGFPFDVVYLRDEHEVHVIAYAHERKRPGYWKHRVSD